MVTGTRRKAHLFPPYCCARGDGQLGGEHQGAEHQGAEHQGGEHQGGEHQGGEHGDRTMRHGPCATAHAFKPPVGRRRAP